MSRWFRYYNDALHDRKVQSLPGELFKAWVNILSIASLNGGSIPGVADVAFGLHVSETKAGALVAKLAVAGLLDRVDGGYFAPHNWSGRQYVTDAADATAAERMRRYRDRKRNGDAVTAVTVTLSDTEQNRTEEGEGRAREAGGLSQDAFDLSDSILKAIGESIESPNWCGFPYTVQKWLNQNIPKDFALSVCAGLRGKHKNYLDKAVENGWREKQSEPERKLGNGQTTGNIVDVSRQLGDRLRAFTRTDQPGVGAGDADVRMLPKG